MIRWPLISTLGVTTLSVLLLTIPGMSLLPSDGQTTIAGITTIDDAVTACSNSGLNGWELAEHAQKMVASKMSYSRRNPCDTPARAFKRGMGYCQQQASALKLNYDRLGIESQLVFTTKAKFPPKVVHGVWEDKIISGHTWLRVTVNGEERDVCPGNLNNLPGKVHFTILAEVKPMNPVLKPFAHLGSVVTNVVRDWESTRFKQVDS